MSTMLHEMAAVIADKIDAGPQVDGEDDAHFIIEMFYIAAVRRRTYRDAAPPD